MEFRLLGRMAVHADGRDVVVGGIKQRAVLAILLLNAGRRVDVDTLVDMVWEDSPPAKPVASLRAYVANLRRELGAADAEAARLLATDSTGYRLDLGEHDLDIAHLERLTAQGRQALTVGDAAAAEDALRRALELWRGPVLQDFRDHRFADAVVHRLDAVRTMAAEGFYEASLQLGRDAELVPGLERQVRIDPLHERLWGQLMIALYRSGRRAEALATYQRARTVLDDELGVAPGAALEHLQREIARESSDLDYSPLRLEVGPAVVDSPRDQRIVGRDRELSVLADLVSSTARGHGALTVIRGDSGTGKSSMAAAVIDDAVEQGFRFAWSTQTDGVREPPMWTWVHIARRLSERSDPAAVERAREMAPELFAAQGVSGRAAARDDAGSATESRFEGADQIASVIALLVGTSPTVLVLDDFHRADRATRDVLEVLSHRLREVPLLLVVTWQDAGPDRPLRPKAFDRLLSRSDTVTIALGPLDVESVGELMSVETRVRPHPDLVAAMYERTAGNPFYVRELARLLHTAGHLDPATREIGVAALPDAVAGVVRRRLSGLTRLTREALSAGALLGVVIESALLAEVLDVSETELRARLAPACRVGILTPSVEVPQRYWFTHAVIRKVAADDLASERREKCHARIATVFAARADTDGYDRVIAAADHAWRAGGHLEPEVVAGLIDVALDSSVSRSEYRAIAELTEHALQMAQRLPPGDSRSERQARHWMQRASVVALLEGFYAPEARAALARAFEAGSAMSESAHFTSAAAMRCVVLLGAARYREARALGEGLITRFEEDGDPAAGAAGFYVRAFVALLEGDPRGAIRAAEQSQAEVPPVPELDNMIALDLRTRTLGIVAYAHAVLGDVDMGRAVARNGIEIARAASNVFAELVLAVNALQINAFAGVVHGTVAEAEAVIEQMNRAGAVDFVTIVRLISAWARGLEPGGPDTVAEVRAAIEEHLSTGWRIFLPLYLRLLADVEHTHGHLDDARHSLRRAELAERATGELAWKNRSPAHRALQSTDRLFTGNAG